MKNRNFAYGLMVGVTLTALTALALLALTSIGKRREIRGKAQSGSFLDTDTDNQDATLCEESRSAAPELESERRNVEPASERW